MLLWMLHGFSTFIGAGTPPSYEKKGYSCSYCGPVVQHAASPHTAAPPANHQGMTLLSSRTFRGAPSAQGYSFFRPRTMIGYSEAAAGMLTGSALTSLSTSFAVQMPFASRAALLSCGTSHKLSRVQTLSGGPCNKRHAGCVCFSTTCSDVDTHQVAGGDKLASTPPIDASR